jgi:L-aspartate oxidase
VVLLSKGQLRESNTWYAQGGISAVLDEPAPGDTVAAHIADTLKAGAGHCDEAAVRLMCTEARRDIAGLERFGVHFDLVPTATRPWGSKPPTPRPASCTPAATPPARRHRQRPDLCSAGPQATGRIRLHGRASATALLQEQGTVTGVEFVQGRPGSIQADAVLLATGGAGQLFAQTTNPAVATADGLALAVRAGAAVADLEFFQFHPTCLVPGASAANPGAAPALDQDPLLISEAVRGEGAILVDGNGKRFMRAYHPDAELAPRDVVSRSIALHLAKLGDPNGHVYLDARVIEQPGEPDSWQAALPHPQPAHPRRRYRLDPRTGPSCARGPLLDGRGLHRPPRPDHGSRALRRRGSCLHRCPRSKPAGQQLPPRRTCFRAARC